jgi:molybdate-binding protein/DNA-binding XRE family transcriptional regulator
MSQQILNHVKRFRLERGWSQQELARRAGISRTAVSAIEMDRLVPSVAAALAISRALECRVETLFSDAETKIDPPQWAWAPHADPCRYWEAEVAGERRLYPVEWSGVAAAHDGVSSRGRLTRHARWLPEQTLVVASCDPAATLLAEEYERSTAFRMIVVSRTSKEALNLLRENRVHVAGVHLAKAGSRGGNAAHVRKILGPGYRLLHVASWDAGIAVARGKRTPSIREATRSSARWVGRQPGSGARECQDRLLDRQAAPSRHARDHRGVAEAIRSGFADYGVCLRLAADDSRLQFLSVQNEAYDLVHRQSDSADPRIEALVRVLRSPTYRELLSELPGYDVARLGELES